MLEKIESGFKTEFSYWLKYGAEIWKLRPVYIYCAIEYKGRVDSEKCNS